MLEEREDLKCSGYCFGCDIHKHFKTIPECREVHAMFKSKGYELKKRREEKMKAQWIKRTEVFCNGTIDMCSEVFDGEVGDTSVALDGIKFTISGQDKDSFIKDLDKLVQKFKI